VKFSLAVFRNTYYVFPSPLVFFSFISLREIFQGNLGSHTLTMAGPLPDQFLE
jgi:hypothetical protein